MKINHIKKLTTYRHLNLYAAAYEDRLGACKQWVFASRKSAPEALDKASPRADAVVVVPVHVESGQLVLIREFRVCLGDYQYGFPAGLVDPGESVAHAAARELKEETGLKLIRIIRTSPPIYSSSGMTDESVSMVFAHCTGRPSLEENEASEDISVHFFSPEKAGALLETPELKFDVKSWIVLSGFSQSGRV